MSKTANSSFMIDLNINCYMTALQLPLMLNEKRKCMTDDQAPVQPVKIYISFNDLQSIEEFEGLSGEWIWATPCGYGEYILDNTPVHPGYAFGDHVFAREQIIGGGDVAVVVRNRLDRADR